MSTYWGYHCKTCPQVDYEDGEDDYSNAFSSSWMNHGDRTLRDIARLAPHFAAISKGDTTGYVEMHVMGYGAGPISWIVEHEGHDIELRNEYGHVEPIDKVPV